MSVATVTMVLGAPTQLTIQWSPPMESNGELLAYSVYCKLSAQQPLCDLYLLCRFGDLADNAFYHQQAVLPVGLSHTQVIGGFEPYTNYTCFMTANTSAGESAAGNSLSAVTDESGKLYLPKHSSSLF